MLSSDFKSIGDYYLHSNPNNYIATLQEIGGGNITSVSRKMIDKIKVLHQEKNLAHAAQIKSGAEAFVDKVNSAGEDRNYTLDTLMDELNDVYRENISNIASIQILNNMKDILANLRVKRDKAKKGETLSEEDAKKALNEFKKKMEDYVDAVTVNYRSVIASYMPLLKEEGLTSIYMPLVKKDPLYKNISQSDPFKKIDDLIEKIKTNKGISFKEILSFFL